MKTKVIFRTLVALSGLFCLLLVSNVGFAIESPPADDTTTESSESVPAEPHITLTYLDVDTSEEIAPAEILTGQLGESVKINVKKIAGYELSDIVMTRSLEFLSTDYTFPIHYAKQTQTEDTEVVSDEPAPDELSFVETDSSEGESAAIPSSSDTQEKTVTNSSQPAFKETTDRAVVKESKKSNSQTTQDQASSKGTEQKTAPPVKKQKAKVNRLPKTSEKTTTPWQLIGLSLLGVTCFYRFKLT